jgi:hypothetical protein
MTPGPWRLWNQFYRLRRHHAFIDHFQEIARAHFTVRRLERRYGNDAVRTAYDKLSGPTPAGA